jgi:flagellar biosynthetic protein FlhB
MAERTEAPTPRRREEARAKGQGVGRSWELSMGLTLGVGTLAISMLLPGMAATMIRQTQSAILTMDGRASNAQLVSETGAAFVSVLTMILPLALLVMIAGVAGNLVSGGLVLSPKAIRFDLNRINPLTGLKRMVDKQMLVRLGLSITKLVILGVISWQVVGSKIPTIVATQGADAATIAGACLAAIFQLGLTITILLAVVALLDFVVQRRRADQSLRMTKQEIRQEYKDQEGDPQIRGARRRRARQMAFARMMDAVPTADVVVTNPTTLAVALKYDSLTMKAPRIVAKGQRLMAERIKQIARDNRVPVVEDKPLARALFSRPIGSEVPGHLYRAVAKLLVLVHQARFGMAGRGNARGPARPAARPASPFAGAGSRPWWADDTAAVAGRGDEIVDGQARALALDQDEVTADGEGADGLGDDLDGFAEPVPDEEALARAMAEDELADLTAEELAEFEAERDGEDRAGAEPLSVEPDEETDR